MRVNIASFFDPKSNSKRRIVFILLLSLVGILYRFYLSSFNISVVIYDMLTYNKIAKAILAGTWGVECCDQNPGYGILLAFIYSLFGVDNLLAVRVIQIVMDVFVAFMLYSIAKKIFPLSAALIIYVLYIFNPFTSSYTGLRLSEILTLFLISIIAYLITQDGFSKKPLIWFLSGMGLGFYLLTRVSGTFSVFIFIAVSTFFCFRSILTRIYFVFFVLCGFLFASSYSLIAYYKSYQVISITPPYNAGKAILYWNFYNDKYPELFVEFDHLNEQYYKLNLEHKRTFLPLIPVYQERYFSLFRERIWTDWQRYITNIFRNIFWIWDKYHLAYYKDTFYPQDKYPLRFLNIFFLLLGIVGLILYVLKKKMKILQSPIFLFTIILIFTVTFIFSLASNESRHSLFVYPLVFLWAGYGLYRFGKKIL